MLNVRLFRYWHDLPEALRTGKPQNEVKHTGKHIFEELYSDLPRLEQFMGAMTGLSRINDNRHWLSDVGMGALIGITSARLVSGRWRVFGLTPPGVAVGPRRTVIVGWHHRF